MLIASLGLHLWLLNFVGAYPNSVPQGENFLEIPQGFEKHYGIVSVDTVLLMNLTIYGTMDGANNWFHELNSTFTKLGHCQSHVDPCIQIQWTDNGYTISGTYTDDVLGGSSSMENEVEAKAGLGDAYEITDLGQPDKVLGMTLKHHDSGDLSIHQRPLILKMISTFGADVEFMKDKDYSKALGMLNHIANGTHPDISFIVNTLMQYASDSRPFHWHLVQHCIAYLKTTTNLAITYRKSESIKPIGYSDSLYTDDPDTWKFSAGFVFKSAGGPVCWKSKMQK